MKTIKGDIAVDDRGRVTFANDFNFKGVKRFYMVENHSKGFVRAWHGHEKEAKYVFVTKGAIKLGVIPFHGRKEEDVEVMTLSADKPEIVYIPPRYFNGFKTLTDDAQVIFYSTSTLEESKDDDIRRPAQMWDIWTEEPR